MSLIDAALTEVPLPRVAKVQTRFAEDCIADVPGMVADQLAGLAGLQPVCPGQRIAVAAGAGGRYMGSVLRQVAATLRQRGAEPFILPAVTYAGETTAQALVERLRESGITESSVDAPISATLDAAVIGHTAEGRAVWLDRLAREAEGIVVVASIKSHTAFRGKYESGLMKTMALGLGRREGAQVCRQGGIYTMDRVVAEVGRQVLHRANILFGVGVVENAYGRPHTIRALEPGEIPLVEPQLLEQAKALSAKLFCRDLDVLVIGKIGTDLSPAGMDTNVIGRFYNERLQSPDLQIRRIALLDLTAASRGDATGIGLADCITRQLYDKLDPQRTYGAALASGLTQAVKIPMVMPDDRRAIAAAIRTAMPADERQVRLAYMENTSRPGLLYLSESLLAEAGSDPRVTLLEEPAPMPFTAEGKLALSF